MNYHIHKSILSVILANALCTVYLSHSSTAKQLLRTNSVYHKTPTLMIVALIQKEEISFLSAASEMSKTTPRPRLQTKPLLATVFRNRKIRIFYLLDILLS